MLVSFVNKKLDERLAFTQFRVVFLSILLAGLTGSVSSSSDWEVSLDECGQNGHHYTADTQHYPYCRRHLDWCSQCNQEGDYSEAE